MLADIHGRPLIWHVWQRVCQATEIGQVYIATDSDEVRMIAETFGARVLMTSPDCQSGTERIASVIDKLDADLILNVQGDEPLVDPGMLDELASAWKKNTCDLVTPVFKIQSLEDLTSPNVVKVARAADGCAIYFSRSPIPYLRDHPQQSWLEHADFWGHIGVYGYRREVLQQYFQLPASPLEQMEKLEQLRFLEAGFTFYTVETSYRPNAVDTAEDLEKVRRLLDNGQER